MKSVYSPKDGAIYPKELYKEYAEAGTWPEDGIEISEEDEIKFRSDQRPPGKLLSYVKGKLCWVDEPEPTKEQLENEAKNKIEILLSEAQASISTLQTKLLLGRKLTNEEAQKVNNALDYMDALNNIDATAAPNIEWPEL